MDTEQDRGVAGAGKCTCGAHDGQGKLRVDADGVTMVGGPRCYWTCMAAFGEVLADATIRIATEEAIAAYRAQQSSRTIFAVPRK